MTLMIFVIWKENLRCEKDLQQISNTLSNTKKEHDDQLRKKQEEIHDIAAHLYVLNDEVKKYLQGHIDSNSMANTKKFMLGRLRNLELPITYNAFKAIEDVWAA